MKIALVHELLTKRGGAERVLRILAAMFPQAPIFTLLYDKAQLGDWFPTERIRTSRLQNIASLLPLPASLSFNHHLFLPFFPRTVEAFDFTGYDVVLSTSSAFTHGIITNGVSKHLCYVHSPARYLWDRTHDVLARAGRGPFGSLRRRVVERMFHNLRIWDSEAADRPDTLLAASRAVQRRIECYWRRSSTVLYPPIADSWLHTATRPYQYSHLKTHDCYLIVSQLVPYKRIDLAIEACNRLHRRLLIAGAGPDRRRLQRLSGETVEFLGYVPETDLPALYAGARALLFPGDEDFGLTPLEAQACGTPVIAFGAGGALETVLTGETGEFFTEPNDVALQEAIEKFEHKKYSADACRAQAARFSRVRFETGIREHVRALTGCT